MKRATAIIALLALSLTGCSTGAAAPAAATTAEAGSSQSQATAEKPAGEAPAGQAQGNGEGQRAPQGKMVRGQISDILGNEVTLALTESPKRPEGTADAGGTGGNSGTGTKPAGGGDGMGPPGGFSQQNREVKLTGETLKLQIPVGVPITARTQGAETTKELSDLVKGDILMIRYDTDETTIIGVTVSSGSGS